MALATQEDVEAVLGRPLSESETARAESLLRRASALVIGYTGQDFEPAPYPETVVEVTASMAARAVDTASAAPAGVEQQTQGPFSVRFSSAASSGGPWLSASDKIMLRPHRLGGGLTSVQLVGERYDITPDEV